MNDRPWSKFACIWAPADGGGLAARLCLLPSRLQDSIVSRCRSWARGRRQVRHWDGALDCEGPRRGATKGAFERIQSLVSNLPCGVGLCDTFPRGVLCYAGPPKLQPASVPLLSQAAAWILPRRRRLIEKAGARPARTHAPDHQSPRGQARHVWSRGEYDNGALWPDSVGCCFKLVATKPRPLV